MLCCSLVALLALILSEVLFLPMNKGNSPWHEQEGRTALEPQDTEEPHLGTPLPLSLLAITCRPPTTKKTCDQDERQR